MRIASAAINYISIPSPKGDHFRGVISPKKNKKKPKSPLLTRVLSSAPIRRMGKRISKRTSRKSPRKEKFEKKSSCEQKSTDLEQGWIAHATTFETEDTLSPRSFESLTVIDGNSCLLQQTEQNEEELFVNCSILHSSTEVNPDQFLDLEAAVDENADTGSIIDNYLYENTLESANTSKIFRMENDVQSNTNGIQDMPETCEKQNAAPHPEGENDVECDDEACEVSSIDNFESSHHILMNDDETISIEKKAVNIINKYTYTNSPSASSSDEIESLLSVIDTTATIDEYNEIDSLVPAADISFFLNDEGGGDFHCAGRLSTPTNATPPIEINVDAASISDVVKNSHREENQEHNSESNDDISITSSHYSYLEAIENITSSAKSDVERAMTIAIEDVEIKSSPKKTTDIGFEEDCYRISFNASNALLLQAMEGASAKAKIDIERATSLALMKFNSARSESSKTETFGMSNVTSKSMSNQILGFFLLIFFLFNFNGNPLTFSWGIRSLSNSLGIDEFQYNHIALEHKSDLSMWTEMQANSTTSFEITHQNAYNIGCDDKIGCLALGNI